MIAHYAYSRRQANAQQVSNVPLPLDVCHPIAKIQLLFVSPLHQLHSATERKPQHAAQLMLLPVADTE